MLVRKHARRDQSAAKPKRNQANSARTSPFCHDCKTLVLQTGVMAPEVGSAALPLHVPGPRCSNRIRRRRRPFGRAMLSTMHSAVEPANGPAPAPRGIWSCHNCFLERPEKRTYDGGRKLGHFERNKNYGTQIGSKLACGAHLCALTRSGPRLHFQGPHPSPWRATRSASFIYFSWGCKGRGVLARDGGRGKPKRGGKGGFFPGFRGFLGEFFFQFSPHPKELFSQAAGA